MGIAIACAASSPARTGCRAAGRKAGSARIIGPANCRPRGAGQSSRTAAYIFWFDRLQITRTSPMIGTPLGTKLRASETAAPVRDIAFENVFEHAAIGMALVALDGRWLRANRALCRIVGYRQEELLATDFQSLTHPDDLPADLKLVQQLLAGEIESYSLEKRYFNRAGDVVWILLNVSLRATIRSSRNISSRKSRTSRPANATSWPCARQKRCFAGSPLRLPSGCSRLTSQGNTPSSAIAGARFRDSTAAPPWGSAGCRRSISRIGTGWSTDGGWRSGRARSSAPSAAS